MVAFRTRVLRTKDFNSFSPQEQRGLRGYWSHFVSLVYVPIQNCKDSRPLSISPTFVSASALEVCAWLIEGVSDLNFDLLRNKRVTGFRLDGSG